jgi:predicted dehydrogenase
MPYKNTRIRELAPGNMTRLSILQIGFGNMGRKWTEYLLKSQFIELKGVAETSPTACDLAKSEFGVDAYTSLEEALRKVDFEAALIVTPPKSHAKIAEAALTSGKHVLIEKPLANDLKEAHWLVKQAANTQRVLMVNQQYRFHPAIRTLAAMIRGGEIGQLLNIRCRFDRDVQHWLPATDFRITMEHGFLVDMGVHHIDLLRAITGQEIIRVYAEGWHMPNSVFTHHAATSALLTLESGAVALYQGNWASNDAPTSWHGRWDIEGEEGHVAWYPPEDPAQSSEIVVRRLNGDTVKIKPERDDKADGLVGVLEAFSRAISSGEEPETNGSDNLKTLETIFACTKAIEEHRVVMARSA